MDPFEQELQRIIAPIDPDASYVGRACYVRLGSVTRAKIELVSGNISNQYDQLQVRILNRTDGEVDTLTIRFLDVWGKQKTTNPNFKSGVDPHIWEHDPKADWYVWQPSQVDYRKLTDEISRYLELFQEPEQAQKDGPMWSQTM